MGLSMVRHMIAKGYPVTVTDISADAAESAENVGTVSAFVIIAVGFDDEAMAVTMAVTMGEGGLIETMKPGSIIAISSTAHPETIERIAAAAAKKDIGIFDAPICRGRRMRDLCGPPCKSRPARARRWMAGRPCPLPGR